MSARDLRLVGLLAAVLALGYCWHRGALDQAADRALLDQRTAVAEQALEGIHARQAVRAEAESTAAARERLHEARFNALWGRYSQIQQFADSLSQEARTRIASDTMIGDTTRGIVLAALDSLDAAGATCATAVAECQARGNELEAQRDSARVSLVETRDALEEQRELVQAWRARAEPGFFEQVRRGLVWLLSGAGLGALIVGLLSG